ncbi:MULTISPECIES: hypothetical protein [unclassified Streptomyces]|uniref:hypothetical protein n=1 Tax=unclassified Streptomyces TaxID=2593676 RepID=UPI002E18D2F5|nr:MULTISPECIES: hypothetical protein [unclassified Streptomyces]
MHEVEAVERAQEVWPEAEAFEMVSGGWTFRVGGGYAWNTDAGRVASAPEGTRSDAVRGIRGI